MGLQPWGGRPVAASLAFNRNPNSWKQTQEAAGLRDTDLLELNPCPEMSQSHYCRYAEPIFTGAGCKAAADVDEDEDDDDDDEHRFRIGSGRQSFRGRTRRDRSIV